MKIIPVLIVDDSPASAEAQARFSGSRFEVHRCGSPDQLKDLNSCRFEIAVVDLLAKTHDGTCLIEHLIETIPNIRCIATVDRPDIASVQQAMKLGCKSYLAKPLSGEAIYSAVQDVAQVSSLLTLSERELQVRLARLLRDLKANWSPCFALANGCSIDCITMRRNVNDL